MRALHLQQGGEENAENKTDSYFFLSCIVYYNNEICRDLPNVLWAWVCVEGESQVSVRPRSGCEGKAPTHIVATKLGANPRP